MGFLLFKMGLLGSLQMFSRLPPKYIYKILARSEKMLKTPEKNRNNE
jgi:hypothetical protein